MSAAPAAARFWARVDKSGDCWIWRGFRTRHGYGIIRPEGPRRVIASRFSWELHNGPIPEGLLVLHRCDNPPCVRPDHLWLGTQTDNMADCAAKGRINRFHPVVTHCQRGHEFTESNTGRTPNGHRRCKRCMNDRQNAHRAEHPRQTDRYVSVTDAARLQASAALEEAIG